MANLDKHLQNVSCVRFSSDDRYLITASDDTTILVWDFNELVVLQVYDMNIITKSDLLRVITTEKEYLKPVHTWNSHSMRVNDLFVSKTSQRVVSVSADQTCKVNHVL